MNAAQLRTRLSIVHSKVNFEQFCEIIGEPTKHGAYDNDYAIGKWEAFQQMITSMHKLGTLFDRLADG